MAEEIVFHLDARKVIESLTLAPAESRRAAKQALRAMARIATKAEKSAAPKLSGTLQKSIHQSKNIKRDGPDRFSVFVGPMGGKANLYRSKAEANTGFVSSSLSSSREEMTAAAWTVYEEAARRIVERRPSRDDA